MAMCTLHSCLWLACRDYIDRAFAACEGRAADLETVQQFLKVELNDIFKQNKAWDVDWDRRPLPL